MRNTDKLNICIIVRDVCFYLGAAAILTEFLIFKAMN